jgi:hypothetical protein
MKQKTSNIVEMAQQVWDEPTLVGALVVIEQFFIEHPRIKSKDDIIRQAYRCKTKQRLDRYMANSVLQYEGMSTTY